MGFNTTVLIQNDALSSIEKDKDFATALVNAILMLSSNCSLKYGIDVPAIADNGKSVFANAATVLEQHHSSETTIVAVGGNYGTVLGHYCSHKHHEPEDKLAIVKELADGLGFRLVKKRVKK